MKIRYQCIACGKLHQTEEAAKRCHEAPVQGIIQGVDRWPRSWLWGN